MSLIPQETVSRVLGSVELKTVVEQVLGIEMKKDGVNWKCCCPFHEEKTPSFVVYTKSQRFKCMAECNLGGGRGGDAIEFVRKAEGLDFRGALERVARIAGVEMPQQQPGSPITDPIARARAVTEWTSKYWEGRLWGEEGAKALEYVRSRGLTDETIRKFRLGLVADSWRDLHPRLERAGYTKQEIQTAGVASPSQQGKGFFDRFKGRLVFPIMTPYGAVVGFGGRLLQSVEGSPKYLNGAETPIYKKSNALFGIQHAREAIRREGRAVVSEGYIDAMALHQAGVACSVAACGTALTAEHLSTLKAMGAKAVTLIFDGDEAGVRAVSTVAPLVLASGLAGYVAQMPGGLDPDELALQRGAEALRAIVAGAAPLSEFLVERAVAARCGTGEAVAAAPLESKVAVLSDLNPFLSAAEPTARALLEVQIAGRLGLPLASIRKEEPQIDNPGKVAVAEALLAELAGLALPDGVESNFRARLTNLIERAGALLGLDLAVETGLAQEGGRDTVHRIVVVESAADGGAYLAQHPNLTGTAKVVVVGENPAAIREEATRLSQAGPVVVLSAFSNTAEGAKLAGLVEAQVRGLPGVLTERAAPARANHGWAGPTTATRRQGLSR